MFFIYVFISISGTYYSQIWPQKQEYVLHTPSTLSENGRDTILNFLNKRYYKTPEKIAETLLHHFLWITSVIVKQLSDNTFSITFSIASPFCALEDYYVSTNGMLFSQSLLSETTQSELPTLIYNSSYCPSDIGAQIILLPPTLFKTYTVVWHNHDKIILIDKNKECFPIITSVTKKITSEIADHCDYIYKKIIETYTKKKKKKYSLDIRFEKQIVLRPQEDIKDEKKPSS